MERQALDFYGEMPYDMKNYLRHNGWHFNKKLCEVALKGLKKKNALGKMETVKPFTKDEVEEMLKRNNVVLENNVGYDSVYVAGMIKADFYKTSIEDEKHLALMVKDMIDDVDQADGFIMHRWYADMIRKGIPVEWEDVL